MCAASPSNLSPLIALNTHDLPRITIIHLYLISTLFCFFVSQFARKESETLNVSEFTDVLFKQLYEAQPKISLEIEAGEMLVDAQGSLLVGQ